MCVGTPPSPSAHTHPSVHRLPSLLVFSRCGFFFVRLNPVLFQFNGRVTNERRIRWRWAAYNHDAVSLLAPFPCSSPHFPTVTFIAIPFFFSRLPLLAFYLASVRHSLFCSFLFRGRSFFNLVLGTFLFCLSLSFLFGFIKTQKKMDMSPSIQIASW